MNENIKCVIEVKNGNKYEVTRTITDEFEVYRDLANDLIHKKINECKYITRIRKVPLYNGYDKIYVIYNNGVRRTYTVKA